LPYLSGLTQIFLNTTITQQYHSRLRKNISILLILALGVVLAFCVDIATGPSMMDIREVIQAVFLPDSVELATKVIVWEVRLPYSLMALLVGAALSLAGLEMQTILNNPMASPFTLGVSSAAAFGAALAILLSVSVPFIEAKWIVSFNAFVFAFGAVMLLQFLSRIGQTRVESLVLLGIAMDFTFKASADALQQFVFWSLGSLSRANWENITVLSGVVAVVIPFSIIASWRMTALRLGEDSARSYGINVGRLRFFSLIRVSLLTATAVAFVGTIGFIGLVGPHIAKLLIGEDHRFSLPASLLSGALVMSLASIASKLISPGAILPVGVITSLIGVPLFVWLIFSKRKK
jgi:iron complex transport system permease protein